MSDSRTQTPPPGQAVPPDRPPAFCPHCGAPLSARAHFCPSCGSPTAASAPAAEPGPQRARPGRRLLVGGIAAVAVAGLVAGAILLGGSDNKPGPPKPAPAVTKADVTDVTDRYSAAYSAESIPALRALFAPTLQRRNSGGPVENRSAALATYAAQFKQLTSPEYRLSGLSIATSRSTASAVGRYRITSPAGTVGGRILFRMQSTGGKLLITGITVTPSKPRVVSRSEVSAMVDRYAAAYSAESVAGLGALFSPGFQRKNGGDPVENRSAALATYGKQFSQLTNPTYTVSGLSTRTTGAFASASARYTITSASGTVRGGVRFEMARTAKGLRITRITTTPESAPTPAPVVPKPPGGGGGGNGGTSPGGGGTDGGGGGEGGGLLWYGPSLPVNPVPDLY